jgi:hypothetical protein
MLANFYQLEHTEDIWKKTLLFADIFASQKCVATSKLDLVVQVLFDILYYLSAPHNRQGQNFFSFFAF